MRNLKIVPADNTITLESFCLCQQKCDGGWRIISTHAIREQAERALKIRQGKVWTVSTHESITPERIFFEGSRAACIRWLKENKQWKNYRAGREVRLGETIWEI